VERDGKLDRQRETGEEYPFKLVIHNSPEHDDFTDIVL
jgi:hypothetical protein